MLRRMIIVAALLVTAISVQGGELGPVTVEKTLVLDDSLKLCSEFTHDRDQEHRPLLILLPMMAHDRASFQPFIGALLQHAAQDTLHPRVPAILNLDLRGHGRSVWKGKTALSFETMSHEEFGKIPGDVAALVAHLSQDSTLAVDWSNITVIGASIGANSAALLTTKLAGIRRIVLLSPGLSYRGLEPEEALRAFTGKALVYSSKGDEYSRDSSQKLAEANKGHVTLRWFGVDQHGTDIINEDPAAMADLVAWISSE